ncbi:UNVERIFIED_CONTAM: hypothetical protein NCL1_43665 [Trichonephila clavipes]
MGRAYIGQKSLYYIVLISIVFSNKNFRKLDYKQDIKDIPTIRNMKVTIKTNNLKLKLIQLFLNKSERDVITFAPQTEL